MKHSHGQISVDVSILDISPNILKQRTCLISIPPHHPKDFQTDGFQSLQKISLPPSTDGLIVSALSPSTSWPIELLLNNILETDLLQPAFIVLAIRPRPPSFRSASSGDFTPFVYGRVCRDITDVLKREYSIL
jgi:hypothetical protein